MFSSSSNKYQKLLLKLFLIKISALVWKFLHDAFFKDNFYEFSFFLNAKFICLRFVD